MRRLAAALAKAACCRRVETASGSQGRRFDPLFPINNQRHPSQGRACHWGECVCSVDGDGTMRHCHFIRTPIGTIYEPGFPAALRPSPCPSAECGCHIGCVPMPELGLYDVFGDGVLERIPLRFP